ncbi:glycosyltransferase family A protein [Neobacillus sp. WH10]|uniref:glycosyltransferase family 2 protein n=1 Tax=Neobacillus sp. WH10 TaxID=3047873 RepID=UPI0024C13D03|nr:glycosyltransferase family A protein [Neobacillus sp. WH10]WHY76638.1 glycosyltransferase family A protein [Neobacillus sp. WH10]
MHTNELVSIIIPTHKGVETIGRAIDSVLSQSYSNIEILVVDDNGLGTPEQIETQKIVDSYLNPKIRYLCHKMNKNGSAARNTGIKHARGLFIALLDDDDIFYREKIATQINCLKTCSDEEIGVCYVGYETIFPNGTKMQMPANIEGKLTYAILRGDAHMPSSSILFKKTVWENVGGFDESFQRHQDWEFLVRLSSMYSIKAINEILMTRIILKRNSPNSAAKFETQRLYYLKKMENYILSLPSDKSEEVYLKHFSDIAKEFFKEGNILKGLKYIFKTKKTIKAFVHLTRNFVKHSKYRKFS